jgi:hypothetical protein
MAMSFTSAAAYGQVSRGDRYSGALWATRSPVIAQHGMAATEQPLASAGAFGGYQAIMWDAKHRAYWGASEMRKDGEAIGY